MPIQMINDGFVDKSREQLPFNSLLTGPTLDLLWTDCCLTAGRESVQGKCSLHLPILFSCAGETFSKLCLLVQLVFQLRVIFLFLLLG